MPGLAPAQEKVPLCSPVLKTSQSREIAKGDGKMLNRLLKVVLMAVVLIMAVPAFARAEEAAGAAGGGCRRYR